MSRTPKKVAGKAAKKTPKTAAEQTKLDERYEWYKGTREVYVKHEEEQQGSLDKQLLALSTAALGFSMLVGEKIANLNDKISLTCLIITWVLLSISVISTIWSFSCGSRAARDYRDQFDRNFEAKKFEPLTSKWSSWTVVFNYAAIVCFTAGIIFLLIFSSLSILNPTKAEAKRMTDKEILTEGRKPQQPALPPEKKGEVPPQPALPPEKKGEVPPQPALPPEKKGVVPPQPPKPPGTKIENTSKTDTPPPETPKK